MVLWDPCKAIQKFVGKTLSRSGHINSFDVFHEEKKSYTRCTGGEHCRPLFQNFPESETVNCVCGNMGRPRPGDKNDNMLMVNVDGC